MLFTEDRRYATIRALRAGETVEFEGVPFRAAADQTLSPGDTYIAERNTGPQLLTVRRHVEEPNLVNGFVTSVEVAYPYDRSECVKVTMIEDEATTKDGGQ